MRKRRGQNRGKINIRSIGRTGVAYKKKEERKEQKKRKNRNKKQKRKHKKNRKRIRGK